MAAVVDAAAATCPLQCPEDIRPMVCKTRDAEADDAAKCEGMSSPPKSRPKSTVNQLNLAGLLLQDGALNGTQRRRLVLEGTTDRQLSEFAFTELPQLRHQRLLFVTDRLIQSTAARDGRCFAFKHST